MQLKPGHYSSPRDAEQIQEIKAAVRAGKAFRQFWLDTAAMWPSHAHLPPLHTAPSKGERGTADPVLHSPEWHRVNAETLAKTWQGTGGNPVSGVGPYLPVSFRELVSKQSPPETPL